LCEEGTKGDYFLFASHHGAEYQIRESAVSGAYILMISYDYTFLSRML
jgi:hypothetical protein